MREFVNKKNETFSSSSSSNDWVIEVSSKSSPSISYNNTICYHFYWVISTVIKMKYFNKMNETFSFSVAISSSSSTWVAGVVAKPTIAIIDSNSCISSYWVWFSFLISTYKKKKFYS